MKLYRLYFEVDGQNIWIYPVNTLLSAAMVIQALWQFSMYPPFGLKSGYSSDVQVSDDSGLTWYNYRDENGGDINVFIEHCQRLGVLPKP